MIVEILKQVHESLTHDLAGKNPIFASGVETAINAYEQAFVESVIKELDSLTLEERINENAS